MKQNAKNGWSILATAFRLGFYSLVEAQTKNKLRKNTFVFCLYSSVTRRYMQGVIYHVFGPRLSVQLIKLKETQSLYVHTVCMRTVKTTKFNVYAQYSESIFVGPLSCIAQVHVHVHVLYMYCTCRIK